MGEGRKHILAGGEEGRAEEGGGRNRRRIKMEVKLIKQCI